MTDLSVERCVACEGGVPKLDGGEIATLLGELDGWSLNDGGRIAKSWTFVDFATAVEAFNVICRVAETENHHPDVCLTDYQKLTVSLWTHAISGLSRNDFILAAKFDAEVATP